MKERKILEIIKLTAEAAQKIIKSQNISLNAIIHHGASFGDLKNDTEIAADKAIGDAVLQVLRQFPELIGRISIEGQCDEFLSSSGDLWVCVDPLDGSLNYLTKGTTLGLPFSFCITILDKIQDAKFGNVLAACVVDLRSDDVWISIRQNGLYQTMVNGKKVFFTPATVRQKLDIGKSIIFGEMYYPDNRDLLVKMFESEKGWLRNPGSAAYEMASVASGVAVAFVCNNQKQHESGAGYALVKGVGGVAVDFDGDDLGEHPYAFTQQNPIILAQNQQIADEILKRIYFHL